MAPRITTIYVFCPDVVVLYASFFSGSCLSVIHCIFYSHSFLVYVLYRVPNSVPTVLHASSILGPNSRFGIRIRSIVFPCTFSILLTSVSTYNLNCAHVPSFSFTFSTSEGAAGSQLKKATVENLLKFSKNIISKCVFYWLKHGAASSRVFRRVLLAAKRPRIEALKLQMCVMVIRALFAVILMTDLIPVFKRPTETQHTVNGDEHFVIF